MIVIALYKQKNIPEIFIAKESSVLMYKFDLKVSYKRLRRKSHSIIRQINEIMKLFMKIIHEFCGSMKI